MERFLKRHQNRIKGIISGFDRVLFRGSLRSISYIGGMDIFLSSQHILYKDFGQFAEKLSHRLKRHAEEMARKKGRPFQYLYGSKVSKEEIARKIMAQDGITQGLICIFSCVEPCQSFTIRSDREAKQLVLKSQERKCLHLYFYYIDRDFGFMHVRLQTWLPFTIQVCINGWEWLARRMDRTGVGYKQRDNCFIQIDDITRAQRMLDRLTERKWTPWLRTLAERVNPWIWADSGFSLHGYYWSIRQGEYSTDVLFQDSESLAAVYPRLVHHAIEQFNTQDVLRFLGRRTNTRFNGEVQSSLQRRIEGIRVKHWIEENSIKMYDKQGSVLRIETTINNPRRFKVRRRTTRHGQRVMGWLPLRKGVVDIRRRVQISRAANERYLEALSVVGTPTPSHKLLDPVSKSQLRNGRYHRPLRPISPEDAKLFQATLQGQFSIQGFRNKDIRTALDLENETDSVARRRISARVTRLLRLLQAHGLIYKVVKTRYYRVSKKGYEVMTTATRFRETDIALLAA